MDRVTKIVAATLAVNGLIIFYLLSDLLSAGNLAVLACCVFTLDIFVSFVNLKTRESSPFCCGSEGHFCPIPALSEGVTFGVYMMTMYGGSLILFFSPPLCCAWLMVFWANLAISFAIHSFHDVQEFETLVGRWFPSDWLFSFKPQHSIDDPTPKTQSKCKDT